MAVTLNEKYVSGFVSDTEVEKISHLTRAAYQVVRERSGAGNDFLGWIDLPVNYDKEEFARIEAAAAKIQKSCDVFVVIGIGGSYLGARAAIEFVKSPLYNNKKKDTPDVYFAGNSISASALADILSICEGRDVCINVISKSGTTTEPAVTFRIFRELLEKKYGEEGARERIFVTTDRKRGKLKEFSTEKGYETFVVPDDIGGRYSVLTAVGLLPIAVAGIDIAAMMQGAADARVALNNDDVANNPCLRYAALRNILYNKGKSIEILVAYEPAVQMFCEWWKQLYGESEGKNGIGIFPASVEFTADLHSMGQYIQDGPRTLMETVVSFDKPRSSVAVPFEMGDPDGLNYLAGRDYADICRTARDAVKAAHISGGVPNIGINVPARDEAGFADLVCFFELACAISGYMSGVNPFDQPGVEAYKKNMFKMLGKPGT